MRPLLAYLSTPSPLNCSSVCWVKTDENLKELRLALHRCDENVASHDGRPKMENQKDPGASAPRWPASSEHPAGEERLLNCRKNLLWEINPIRLELAPHFLAL